MSRSPLTLAIMNDYEVVVRGVQAMLAPFGERVSVLEVGTDDKVEQPVDITLYDTFGADDADGDGLEALLAQSPGAVVVYGWSLEPDVVELALARGCRGYLDKSLEAEGLVAALERVRSGEVVVVPAGPGQSPVADGPAGVWPGREVGLSPREAEVVALVTRGLTNQEIAAQIYLSINSVKTYIRGAYRKMGVTRRSQAVRWGIQHGLQPVDLHVSHPGATTSRPDQAGT